MEIKHTQKVERNLGIASTVSADMLIPSLREGFGKFLRDNSSLGDNWVQTAYDLVLGNVTKGQLGKSDFKGSNSYLGVAISTLCPEISLIEGKQLLDLYKQAGNKNPFGQVYVDFGVQVNGKSDTNQLQAKALLGSYKQNGIVQKSNDVYVPDFAQLKLIADQKAGLVFKLKDGVKQDNLTISSEYPFRYFGNDGLFRAYLNNDGNWGADDGGLANFNGSGRVVRYDAEGVEAKKVEPKKKDLVSTLMDKF